MDEKRQLRKYLRIAWWHIIRLQPFGSDGTWRFEHPYLHTMLVATSVPVTFTVLCVSGSFGDWAYPVASWAIWGLGCFAAVWIDRRLMAPHSLDYTGRHRSEGEPHE